MRAVSAKPCASCRVVVRRDGVRHGGGRGRRGPQAGGGGRRAHGGQGFAGRADDSDGRGAPVRLAGVGEQGGVAGRELRGRAGVGGGGQGLRGQGGRRPGRASRDERRGRRQGGRERGRARRRRGARRRRQWGWGGGRRRGEAAEHGPERVARERPDELERAARLARGLGRVAHVRRQEPPHPRRGGHEALSEPAAAPPGRRGPREEEDRGDQGSDGRDRPPQAAEPRVPDQQAAAPHGARAEHLRDAQGRDPDAPEHATTRPREPRRRARAAPRPRDARQVESRGGTLG